MPEYIDFPSTTNNPTFHFGNHNALLPMGRAAALSESEDRYTMIPNISGSEGLIGPTYHPRGEAGFNSPGSKAYHARYGSLVDGNLAAIHPEKYPNHRYNQPIVSPKDMQEKWDYMLRQFPRLHYQYISTPPNSINLED